MLIPIDSTGRTYAVPAHTLPSARGQGEPLSSQLTPPSGSSFVALMLDDLTENYILASDSGYGLIVKLEDMVTKNKKGKATLNVPKTGNAITPRPVLNIESDLIAVVTTSGYLLVYPAQELPLLAKGKGVKLINIPAKLLKGRDETIAAVIAFAKEQSLIVYSGKRHLRLKGPDLDHYIGERSFRGKKLPRGFQQVNNLAVE